MAMSDDEKIHVGANNAKYPTRRCREVAPLGFRPGYDSDGPPTLNHF